MNNDVWIGQIAAPVAVIAGLLACFWGYRLLKVTLAIVGLLAGAAGGWEFGLSLAPGNTGIALACALICGLLGAILCVWLFFFGIFLLGASAGAIIAAGLFEGTGHQAPPLLLLVFAVIFGVLALVLQKFMIIVSTAFGGSYLITAGILHFVGAAPKAAPLWFDRVSSPSAGALGYVALALWFVLGLLGIRFQYAGRRGPDNASRQETQPT